ncbi:hypothetical protein [Variovorax rhizosphaerae]|uniref:Uncharacterized protein n=1 Tax=Variovorax rhizosphaerae TaxID=1836200 RepID=A0ABU8WCF2_9BURK
MNDPSLSWPLWAGVVAIGIYHGLNPAMGWPLAVARGLDQKRGAAVFGSWMPLGAGHLLAMAMVLVPFAVLAWLLQWSREIRIVVGAGVLLFGIAQLVLPQRHRRLARIKPTQLALWSFLMATAHGAALMLLPILMGLCDAPAATPATNPFDHAAVMDLMRTSLATAVIVSLVHTAAMIGSGLSAAWVVYRYLGLRALRSAWLNLEKVWALGLIASGGAAVMTAMTVTSSM